MEQITGTAHRRADFDHFHEVVLPAALAAGNAALVARDLRDTAPISFELPDGRCVTYVPTPDGVDIVRAITADTGAVVAIDESDWADFVHEMRSAFGLLYAGLVQARTGSLEHLIRWEPPLRAMFCGRPVYDPDELEFVDLRGEPLDLHRTFTLDDDPAELRHFMSQTGFAHVRGVVTPDALAGLVAEVDRLQDAATPGDDRSWWARRADGTDVVCRLTYVSERSEVLARAHELPGLQQLVGIVAPDGAELAVFDDRSDGHSVVIKHPEVAEGLSDLPWHIDCGLGGHPVLCPSVLVGVQLEDASAGAGRLHFLAGSWRTSCHQLTTAQTESGRYPVVALDTRAGDVTLHYGHGMHLAPPPSGAVTYRRTLYLAWSNVAGAEVIPPGQGYNDVVLHSGEDNRVRSVPEQLQQA